ncbi:hypothetical protein [Actinacidiphila rubida]|uniref:Uncharacterized protein n=1 Tax=Actinacidiphila rubida TaxID=310780 RepID=A0A1H8TBA3_9ACTN|nr:hypothetical protein [Actinacidiphila rubida]SEO88095.1 hypothetical protein SAMN05216267_105025 [Actinacidiphila rubida]
MNSHVLVDTDGMVRLAQHFAAASTQLDGITGTIEDRNPGPSSFGHGPAADSANRAYLSMTGQISEGCNRLAQLSLRAHEALQHGGIIYRRIEEENTQIASRLASQA